MRRILIPALCMVIIFIISSCHRGETPKKTNLLGKSAKSEAKKKISTAKNLIRIRSFEWALDNLNEAESLDPENIEIYIIRSSAYYNLKRYKDCVADCTKAIAMSKKKNTCQDIYITALVRRGAAYMNMRQFKEAVSDLNEVIKNKPNFAFAYYDRGRCWFELGDMDKAKDDFKQVLKLNPEPDIANRTREFLKKIE